jgi:hypothetical protein
MRVITKKLTLNCSWKEGDNSTMQDDAQTGASREECREGHACPFAKRKSQPRKTGFSLPENN